MVCLEVTITMTATNAVANSKNLKPTSTTTGPILPLMFSADGFLVEADGGVVVSTAMASLI